MCVRELLQDVTEKMQRHRARAWSFDPGKNAELGNVWQWIGPGGHKEGRSKWLGEEAQQVVLLLRWRLYRELYGRRGPSKSPGGETMVPEGFRWRRLSGRSERMLWSSCFPCSSSLAEKAKGGSGCLSEP